MYMNILFLFSFLWSTISASVLLPPLQSTSLATLNGRQFLHLGSSTDASGSSSLSRRLKGNDVAMAIPGYSIGEQVIVGGMLNFLQLYNFIITARVLLSWFPQAQGVGFLQPVYAITDPYLNLFRGIIPPLGGLDLSPIVAFFTLNVLSSTTAAIGCEIPNKNKSAGLRRFKI